MNGIPKSGSPSVPVVPSGSEAYGSEFFAKIQDGSLRSARVIVPMVVSMLQPKSVIDIGCGVGTWLRAFKECGVDDIQGIDGDYVRRDQLQIDPLFFKPMELAMPDKMPRSFNLAVSLEVAEHLPTSSSTRFVEFLTSLAPAVLFSAAIPGQLGTSHINEQWPWFWQKKFEAHGYVRCDLIRPRVWGNSQVEFWYRQNIFLYVRKDRLNELSLASKDSGFLYSVEDDPMQVIRESLLRKIVEDPGVLVSFRRCFTAIGNSVRRRLRMR